MPGSGEDPTWLPAQTANWAAVYTGRGFGISPRRLSRRHRCHYATEAPSERRSPFGILVVMHPAETAILHGLLHECGAEVLTASTCVEASRALDLGVSIRAIFSTRWLPDGGFQDLVQMGGRCPEPTPLRFQLRSSRKWPSGRG